MDLSRPYGVISHPLDSSVLVVLEGTTRPLTGHEVARLAPEGTQQGIWKALNRLVGEGLVERQDVGSSALYTLNRDHLATPAVEILVGIRRELIERVRAELQRWEIEPVHASLFGSAARGDGGLDSDIDIFIVRPPGIDPEDRTWREQAARLADVIHRWTGNRAGISEVGEEELATLAYDRPPVVTELEADAVVLFGRQIGSLFEVVG